MISHAALARLAQAAYSGAPNVAVGDTGAYFTETDDEFIVAVPGTHPDNIANWLTDLDARPKWFAGIGICHAGFGNDGAWLWEAIKARLPTNKLISFTGHSLGGAIAQVLSACHAADWHGRCRVVTFGAPRVAFFLNRTLAPLVNAATQHAFYQRAGDVVPDIPAWPWFKHPARGDGIGRAVLTLDPAVNHSIDRYAGDLEAMGV